jgi:DIS3-like exonuclease 2
LQSPSLPAPRHLVFLSIGVDEGSVEAEDASDLGFPRRVSFEEIERVCIMRATGEHTAAVPIPAPPPPPAAAASATEEAEKERRKNRRRPSRRSKQAAVAAPQGPLADAAGPRSVRSMPPMHVGSGGAGVDAEAEASAAGTSQSCPLLPTPRPTEAPVSRVGGGAPAMRYFQPHWPERAVEDAVKVFAGAMGGLRLRGCDFA